MPIVFTMLLLNNLGINVYRSIASVASTKCTQLDITMDLKEVHCDARNGMNLVQDQ